MHHHCPEETMLIKNPSKTRNAAGTVVSAELECRTRNDRQTYLSITRAIANAQFVLADQELSRRLWQHVGDRELEVGRSLHLLYGGWDLDDNEEVQDADAQFLALAIY